MALASLILGVVGLMFRYKLCAWLAVFACLGSVANMRKKDFDFKQVACSLLSVFKRTDARESSGLAAAVAA